MSAKRSGFLFAAAVAAALALSGLIAFRPRRRASSSTPLSAGERALQLYGEVDTRDPFAGRPLPTAAAAPRGAGLDAQYLDTLGKKVSLLEAKKPAPGGRTRGAGAGTGLELDG